MIERLEQHHVEDALPLLLEFKEASPYKDVETSDRCLCAALMAGADSGLSAICYKDGKAVGLLLAVKSPLWINDSIIASVELAWWVSKDARGVGFKLLKKHEELAEEAGISVMSLSTLSTTGLDDALIKRGYKQTETAWVRGI